MSLVAEVIASKKQGPGHKDLLIGMEKLIKQSDEARVSVCEALNGHYVTLMKTLNDTLSLHNKISSCMENINLLDNEIKENVIPSIEGSASEIETVTIRWKEIKEELVVTQMFLDIHNLLDESHKAFESKNYILTVNNLNKVEEILRETAGKEIESQLDIISSLKEELILLRTDIVYRVGEVWNKFISFSNEELTSGENRVNLSVLDVETNKSDIKMENISQMLSALNTLGELKRYIRVFSKTLLQHFIKPVLCEGSEIVIFHQAEYGIYVLYTKKSENFLKISDPESAVCALSHLEKLFEFLNINFSPYNLEEENKKTSLLSLLGNEIGEEFIKLVLNNCLEESIPSERKELKNFNQVQQKVEEFHHYLVDIGFYSEDHKSLLNFVSNVEVAFGNKTCSDLLVKGRNLMTKSLNVTANIESLSPEGPLAALDEYGNTFQETSSTLQKLSPKTFNLTKCQVSLSVCELVNLIYKTMEEACVSSEDFAEKLFHTVRNLLSMYWHIIPTAHSQTIANIPDHAALIHNNAVYLAHHAFLLGHHYKNRLPISSQTTTITAVDLGYMIRSTGCNVFLKSMLNHKNHLQDLIRKGVEAASLKWEETSVNPLQMSVQNCLKYLTKLKNAWMKILPHSVYCKSIGTLAGSVVEDLVLRVVALEEISTDEAIALINILSLLESNIPNLFSSDDEHVSQAEALKEVRLWEKLKELIIVLGASLQDLNERWLGGKGPLAHNFTSEEVKHLIKAIFQNTERRAQLLSKIK